MPPRGLDEILDLYGDPHPYVREDGTISPLWDARMVAVAFPKPLPLGWVPTRANSARVNQAIAAEVALVFELLVKCSAWSLFRTYDGGYCWRPKRNSLRCFSMHALGAALDFNAETNGQGGPGDMDLRVVKVFEDAGWTWGGRWPGKQCDPMHFQFGSGY